MGRSVNVSAKSSVRTGERQTDRALLGLRRAAATDREDSLGLLDGQEAAHDVLELLEEVEAPDVARRVRDVRRAPREADEVECELGARRDSLTPGAVAN